MIWLTWRQFRGQFVATIALLAALTAYLIYVGYAIRNAYRTDILGCLPANGCELDKVKDLFVQDHRSMVTIPAIVLIAVPAIIGVFWGGPLITRELETNTHRLVWNQTVTRTHWLAVKLAVVGTAAVAVTGALSLVLTWAASRYDQLVGSRFDPLSFASRNVAPIGYVIFAFVLGTTAGLFLRRTVKAMAVTLLLVGVIQLLIPTIARPYLRPPVTQSVTYDAAVREQGGILSINRDAPMAVTGYAVPGALMLTDHEDLLTSSGQKAGAETVLDCAGTQGQPPRPQANGLDQLENCVAKHNLHFSIRLQPPSRYWSFQWIEFAAFIVLAGLLSGLAFWQIRRVRG